MKNKEHYQSFLNEYKEGFYYYENGKIFSNYKRVNANKRVILEEPKRVASKGKRGYYRFSFKGKSFYEHRIIYLIFNGLDDLFEHQCIDHINGDKSDNRIENLRGLSIKENTLSAERIGLFKRTYGEINGMCKIKIEEINQIKDLVSYGFRQREVAEMFNVKQSHISCIFNNKKRKNG